MLLGYIYFHLAGEAYALVSIGLISFAAVAQFAPALFGGMYWRGGTRRGAMAGLLLGFGLWIYTLMLPSIAKSGWLPTDFLQHGPWGISWLKPEQLLGLTGMDNLTHSLFWSLTANLAAYVVVSLWRGPTTAETSQALLFVEVFQRSKTGEPVFWRGRTRVQDLVALTTRFLGAQRAQRLFQDYARQHRRAAGSTRSSPTRSWCATSKCSWRAPSAARRPGSWWPRSRTKTRWCSTTCCRSWTRPRSCAPIRSSWRRSRPRWSAPPASCAPPMPSSRAWTGSRTTSCRRSRTSCARR